MIKLIGLFRRKPGMSREEFIHYYENRHAPLIKSLMPQLCEYRRSYPLADGTFEAGHVPAAKGEAYDVITECWFASQEAFDEMTKVTMDPETSGRIAEDEANFLDRERMVMFLVDERRTEF